MATSEGEVGLKHLGFVKVLAINAVFVVLKLYDFAKYMSGPLKSTVGKVEGVVTAVLGPLYNAFKPIFNYTLLFLDNKVDAASYIFDKYAPRIVKSVISKTLSIVKNALHSMQGANDMGPVVAISHAGKEAFDERTPPIVKDLISKAGSMVDKASNLVQEAATKGPFEAISQVGEKSKEFAVRQMVMGWYKANQDSFLSGILEILLPIVVYLLDIYNHLVKYFKGKGWSSLFSYIPLIPLEEIEKTIKQVEEAIVDARRSSKNESKSK